jgi:hypothetical protein
LKKINCERPADIQDIPTGLSANQSKTTANGLFSSSDLYIGTLLKKTLIASKPNCIGAGGGVVFH